MTGGAAASPGLASAAEKAFGCIVQLAYGSTESGLVSAFRPTDAPGRPGTVGKIRPGLNYRFLDEGGTVAPAGELYLQVPVAVRPSNYLNAAGPYDADGWLATGDIGMIDEDGNLVLTGRRAEFINAGGSKRAPELFEKQFVGVPGVSQVAAFAISNGWGSDDAGILLVADREKTTDNEIRVALAEGIKKGFVFRIFFVDKIPLTQAGKLDRKYLSELHRERVADLLL